jgi:hypothetical protein
VLEPTTPWHATSTPRTMPLHLQSLQVSNIHKLKGESQVRLCVESEVLIHFRRSERANFSNSIDRIDNTCQLLSPELRQRAL